jgi:type IX secretion system PorP/SprF family membrane protein
MKTKELIIFVAFLIIATTLKSQDQNYSQFFNNGLYYNPAYTGLFGGVKTFFNYRNQWASLPYDFRSYNVAVDVALPSLPGAGGIGLIFNNNNEGEGMVKNSIVGLLMSARVNADEDLAIQFGITTALCQKKIDWDGLVFPDQLDGKNGNIYSTNFTEPYRSNVIYPDFNFGTLLYYKSDGLNARFGGAIHHIFQPDIGFLNAESDLPMKFVAHGDLVIPFKSRRRSSSEPKVNPGILYENQQRANTFSIGINGYLSNLYLGFWYRNEDINTTNLNTLILLTGVSIPFQDESRIKLMYSYDYLINELITTGGSHEISIVFEFNNENIFGSSHGYGKKRNYGTEPCSDF